MLVSQIWNYFNEKEQELILSLSFFSGYVYVNPGGIGYYFNEINANSDRPQVNYLNSLNAVIRKGISLGIFQSVDSEFDYLKLSPVFQLYTSSILGQQQHKKAQIESSFVVYYKNAAAEFRNMFSGQDENLRSEVYELIHFEQANLLKALRILLKSGKTDMMITSVLRYYYTYLHQNEQWIGLSTQVVEKISAEPIAEAPSVIIANMDSLANSLMEIGKPDEAATIFRKVLEQFHQALAADRWMEAAILNSLAHCIRDYEEQLSIFYQALDIARQVNHQRLVASLTFNISETYYLCNRLGESHELALQAYQLFADLGDLPAQIKALRALASHEQKNAHWRKAEQYLAEALTLADSLKDLNDKGFILQELASLYFLQEDVDNTKAYAEKAIVVFLETGHTPGLGNAYNLLGAMSFKAGAIAEGLDYTQRAILCFDQTQDWAQMAQAFGNIALACYELQWWDEAKTELEKSLYLYDTIHNEYEVHRWKILLGAIHLQLDEIPHAQEHCFQAAAFFHAAGDKEQLMNCESLMKAIVGQSNDAQFEQRFKSTYL